MLEEKRLKVALLWPVKRECLKMNQMSYIYLLMSIIFHLRLDVVLTQDQYGSDDSYNPNYDAGEHCKTDPDYHHNEVECPKADFFDSSIVKKLNEDPNLKGKNVKYCCKDHGFVYNHACEDKLKCGIEDENTDRIIAHDYALSCPEGCITYTEQNLSNPIFEFNSDGSLSLSNTHPNVKYFSVKDYCVGYFCNASDEWMPGINVCVCYDDKILDSRYEKQTYKRCCDHGFIEKNHDKSEITCKPNPKDINSNEVPNPKDINLMTLGTQTKASLECDVPFELRKMHEFGKNSLHRKLKTHIGSLDNNGTHLKLSYAPAPKAETNLTLELKGNHYCIGMVVPVQDQVGNVENFGGYYPELAYCSSVLSPCNGKIPCINTCGCPRNDQMLLPSGECQDMSQEVSKQLTNNYGLAMKDHTKLFHDDIFKNISLDNFRNVYTSSEMIDHVPCTNGKDTKDDLDPCRDSDESFEIKFNSDENKPYVKETKTGEEFKNFCLMINDDLTYNAKVCRKTRTEKMQTKEKFTVALLVISSILLIFTIGIYTYYRQLLTEYTKIMRHFASVLLITYIIMIINKSVHLGDAVHPGLCQFSGFLLHYLMVCTFFLMTSMAVFIWNKVRSHSNKGKLARFYGTEEWFSKFLVAFSYVASVLITLITLIVEFASPKCVSYRPKFGVNGGSCFFNERVAKGIWLFVPMAIALMINFGAFITVLTAIWKKNKAIKSMNQGNTRIQAKTKKDDGFVSQAYMYLKMFLGMGFVWFVEIISGMAGESAHEATWYLFDAINALQGLWVFLIFVCQPDAKKRVMKTTGLDTVFTSGTKSKNIKMKNLKPGKGLGGRQHSGNSESDAPTSSFVPSAFVPMGEQTALTNVSQA